MSISSKQNTSSANLLEDIQKTTSTLPADLVDEISAIMISEQPEQTHFWEIAKSLGAYYNNNQVTGRIRERCVSIISRIRDFQGEQARQSTAATTVVFGTSGWRGVIGRDFTIENVHKVVRGIIEMMKTEEFLKTNNYHSFKEVRRAGILLLRDNRFMGEKFMEAAMKELAAEKIKIHFAGECPTGVGSAVLTELKAAGSINFTPSHNPMEYAGIKFNPGDGGPADINLSSIIEEKANKYMKSHIGFRPSKADFSGLKTDVDAAAVFLDFIKNKSKVFDLEKIHGWLHKNKKNLYILIDFMHGSSRGYIEKLLGEDTVDELCKAGSLEFVHTKDDYSFHGVKPEPSAKNQKPLIEKLSLSGRKYTLAVALDPDADRIRFADSDMDIDMNRFGAIAYANLLERGMEQGIASTAPSSDFALEIARQNNMPVFETEVGFKYFRKPLSEKKVMVAFEESDGISFIGHTLEKCALAGFLAALDAMAASEKNLSGQYKNLQKKYGYFYPDKAGADVQGVSVEAWQQYKNDVLDTLQHKMYRVEDFVEICAENKKIREINIIDGLKLIFEDKSWILLRPSGTEPKFRYYYEVADTVEIADASKRLETYHMAAESILRKARDIVDQQSS